MSISSQEAAADTEWTPTGHRNRMVQGLCRVTRSQTLQRQTTESNNRFQPLTEEEEPRDLLYAFRRAPEEEINFESPQAQVPDQLTGLDSPSDADSDSTSDTDTDSDSDYESEAEDMPNSDPKTTKQVLLELIESRRPEQAKPFHGKPTQVDKLEFRATLISALKSVPCEYTDSGYSWILEDKDTYKARMGEDPPDPPTYQGPEDPAWDSVQKKKWKRDTKYYTHFKTVLQSIYDVIDMRFDGYMDEFKGTDDLINREYFFKPRELLDELEKSNSATDNPITMFTQLQSKISEERIHPLTVAGLNAYFRRIEQQREIANGLNVTSQTCQLPWTYLSQIALAAISLSGFPGDRVIEYQTQWEDSPGATKEGKARWSAFKVYLSNC